MNTYKNTEKRGSAMDATQPGRETPLAQVQELKELKRRYRIYNDETLRRWMTAVTGSHRQAMAEILKERGGLP